MDETERDGRGNREETEVVILLAVGQEDETGEWGGETGQGSGVRGGRETDGLHSGRRVRYSRAGVVRCPFACLRKHTPLFLLDGP